MTFAFSSRLSASVTVMSVAPSITWLLVRIYPSERTITPEPRLCSSWRRGRSERCPSEPCPSEFRPKNCRKKGSISGGIFCALTLDIFEEEMFTTAGSARSTTGAKLVSIEPGVKVAVAAATGANPGECSAHNPDPPMAPTAPATRQYTKTLDSLRNSCLFIFQITPSLLLPVQIYRRAIRNFIPSKMKVPAGFRCPHPFLLTTARLSIGLSRR